MALEIRPYREEEKQAFFRVPSIVFGNYTGEPAPTQTEGGFGILPEWSLCAFEDGVLATTYGAFPLVMRMNGRKAPLAGVTIVGTLPQFRRRGHLRQIMQADFQRRYEQRMEPIAALLASIAAIYQRYGYAVCSTSVRYQIDPKLVNFAPTLPATAGTWREASFDERPLLERLYREFAAPRNGYLHRAPVMWDGQVLGIGAMDGADGMPAGRSLLAVYEEQGEPTGYLAYLPRSMQTAADGAPPGQRVIVRDFIWNTPGAYRAGWEFVRNFDLASRIWMPSMPTDDPAMSVMLDPRELNATHRDHLMGRILDIERALPLRPYGAEGRVVFEVRDEMCPWNAGRWALETSGPEAAVARTKESAQLTLDVSALAQLLWGQVSPTNEVRSGRAETTGAAPLALWDAIWRTEYAPFCPNWF